MPLIAGNSVSPTDSKLFSPSASYRTRRKSSLSNLPFTSTTELQDNDEFYDRHDTKRKYCFRCQKLIERDDIKIAPALTSSILTPGYIDSMESHHTPMSTPNSSYGSPSFIYNNNNSRSCSSSSGTTRRRRSSQPLTASFQESLLTGRTSGVPSVPIAFTAKLVISEFEASTGKPIVSNKEYARNSIPFDAVYYNWETDTTTTSPTNTSTKMKDSPYVGTIDLYKSFIEREIAKLDEAKLHASKRSFPGHIIPECFVLQLLLINDQENVCDCLVLKYNLAGEDLHNGEKTFIRKSSFILSQNEKQFISTLQINVGKIKGRYILFNNIKVIFHNRILPIMNNEESVNATVPMLKQSEILRGGKSKLNLEYYKKCSTCNVLNEKLLCLQAVEDTPVPVYKLPSKPLPQHDTTPSPRSSVSKKLIFNQFDEANGAHHQYRDTQVFEEESELEEEEMMKENSISFRNKRRGSFMF